MIERIKNDELSVLCGFSKLKKLNLINEFISEFKNKNKLSCVMITQNGKETEKVIGIITAWDIIGR